MKLLPYFSEEIQCPNCGSREFKLRKNNKKEEFVDMFCENCGQWIKFANKKEKKYYLNLNNLDSFGDIKLAEIEKRNEQYSNDNYINKVSEYNEKTYCSLDINELESILYDLNALSKKITNFIIEITKDEN